MKNILTLYYEDHPHTPERFNALADELESEVRSALTDPQLEYLDEFAKTDRVLTLDVLEDALGKGAEHISNMRNGNRPISRATMRTLDLLLRRVRERPDLVRRAMEDYLDREKS